jgi:hypothetical protein
MNDLFFEIRKDCNMPKELTWRKAIDKILASSPRPLHYKEITEQIISEGLRKSLGATPADTVNAQISIAINHESENCPYVRVSKGIYALKNRSSVSSVVPEKLTPEVIESEEKEEQYDIISSFGMFWRKNDIEWTATPKLLGMQQIGATPVDFCKQLGIYLLYDGREVIYVGRTTDRPLGRRLYEHTIDRMSARWDRFSWFGLLPVSDDGNLCSLPTQYVAAKLIPAIEAILIEALEPRQNRKRGDDLAAVEYIQKINPEIEKKKVLDTMMNLISKQ